jgi:hypothetical protein
LFGRISTLQQNEGLREQFLSKEFGEAAYKTAFQQLTDASSDTAKMLVAARDSISADQTVFRSEVEAESNLTPQLRLGMLDARSRTNLELEAQGRTEGAKLATVRDIVKQTLEISRPSGGTGFEAFGNFVERNASFVTEELGIRNGRLAGSTAAEEAISGIELLQGRMTGLQFGGLIGDEQATFDALQGQVKLLADFVAGEARGGSLSPVEIDRAQRLATGAVERNRSIPMDEVMGGRSQIQQYQDNAALLEKLATLLEGIRDNTRPLTNQRPPNYSTGLSAGAAGAAQP